MKKVELFELELHVHKTERYRIKRAENNAIDFALRTAANLVGPLAKHIMRTPYGSHIHLPAYTLYVPFIQRLTNEFDFCRLEWIKSTC
jgi:hypothetical protein